MKIEFFYDCSSPWTYLGFEAIQPLAAEFGAELVWRPILVGGIFNAINPTADMRKHPPLPEAKLAYFRKDIGDWEKAMGVVIKFPPTGHPVNSVKVMRACIVLQETTPEKLVPFSRAAFQAYFTHDRDLSTDPVVEDLCRAVDVDPAWMFGRISEQGVKDALRRNVDEAMARGAFGSPTMYLDGDDMYFGVDRIQLLRKAMERRTALTEAG